MCGSCKIFKVFGHFSTLRLKVLIDISMSLDKTIERERETQREIMCAS